MTPRVPLPRLTLFTGGKECSLCEVAKQDLAIVRQTHPFDIQLWNIRSPPAGVDPWEAKKWRRLYQYDIQDSETSYRHPKTQSYAGTMVGRDESLGESSRAAVERMKIKGAEGWKPYRSVFGTPIKRRRVEESNDELPTAARGNGKVKERTAPWRRKVGSAWFTLDSSLGHELTGEKEQEEFARIMEDTFRDFTDGVIVPPKDVVEVWEGDEHSFKVDITPQKLVIIGEREFDPDEHDSKTRDQHRPLQTCWNCDEPGHSVSACPKPRNYAAINARRAAFQLEREAVPESAMVWLRGYRFTEKERTRRLALVDRFTPGRVSQAVADAIFHAPPPEPRDVGEEGEEEGEIGVGEEERAMMQRKKERGEWPWLQWMAKWGYPPGYFTEKDPIHFLREILQSMPVDEEDEGELLKIFGGDLEGGTGPTSPNGSTSEESSGLPITPARKVSPGELEKASPGNHSDSGSDMDLEPDSPTAAKAIPLPPSSPPPPPPPPDDPLPPGPPSRAPPDTPHMLPDSFMGFVNGRRTRSWIPPDHPISRPPPELIINPPHPWSPVKWAIFPTQLFESPRLLVYDETYPLPLGW